MIQNVMVVGAGSAGLMAAIALKRKIPKLNVRIVRSPEIGIIGVGESTTPVFVQFLFEYLGIDRRRFYAVAKPTWKTGVKFLWGPRESFNYAFDFQLDSHWGDLSRPNGYYCEDEFDSVNLNSALMSQNKVFMAQPNGGGPIISNFAAFHLFNPWLVSALEGVARAVGIEFIDGKITAAPVGEKGIESLLLEDGRKLEADFYVDASGFRSELLSRALETPFVSYENALYCDRAIVGTWDRTSEPIHPYTIAETMDAGWCWQVDHEHAINRGYVYSSRFISDDHAREEFSKKNPKARVADRVLKFRSGRYQKGWVKNVFGIGNAGGFVEPLEATALMVTGSQIHTMVDMLIHSQLDPQPRMLELYNSVYAEWWDGIRDFLAIHYRFNTRIKTPFWTTCLNEVDVSSVQPLLDFYEENGPTGLCRTFLNSTIRTVNQFGVEGFLVMLIGQKVPYRVRQPVSAEEVQRFRAHCADHKRAAQSGYTVEGALKMIRHPNWRWFGEKG